jgi:RND family efflux transporter MFP subunit
MSTGYIARAFCLARKPLPLNSPGATPTTTGWGTVPIFQRNWFAGLAAGLLCSTGAGAVDFDCVIQPRQVVEIRSPVEGLLERIAVDRGDMVRRGQELAFIDTSVERVLAQGAKYRAEMDGATQVGQSKVQLSTRRFERAEELLRQQYVTQQAKDEALAEKQVALAELQEAKDNRKLAEIELQRQLTLIQLKTVRSPINGVVTERILNVGELAEAGVGRKPILRLAEIETLLVEAVLPADAYRQVRLGTIGRVTPVSPKGDEVDATVTVIDRVPDAGSGTFGVRLQLPNKDGRLLAGVRCRVAFTDLKLSATPPPDAPVRNAKAATKRPKAIATK